MASNDARSRLRQQRMVIRPGAVSVNNVHGHQHPGQPPSTTSLGVAPLHQCPGQPPIINVTWGVPNPLTNTARSRLRHQRCVSQSLWKRLDSGSRAMECRTSYLEERSRAHADFDLDKSLRHSIGSWKWIAIVEDSNVQCAQSIAPLGAAPVINICVNRTGSTEGLRMSPLYDNQCHLGWPPPFNIARSRLRHQRSF